MPVCVGSQQQQGSFVPAQRQTGIPQSQRYKGTSFQGDDDLAKAIFSSSLFDEGGPRKKMGKCQLPFSFPSSAANNSFQLLTGSCAAHLNGEEQKCCTCLVLCSSQEAFNPTHRESSSIKFMDGVLLVVMRHKYSSMEETKLSTCVIAKTNGIIDNLALTFPTNFPCHSHVFSQPNRPGKKPLSFSSCSVIVKASPAQRRTPHKEKPHICQKHMSNLNGNCDFAADAEQH